MTGLVAAPFVFLVGLTAAGIAATLMQIRIGRPVSFSEPYVSRGWIALVLATLAAGPMMLGNEGLLARRERRIGRAASLLAAAVAGLWTSATGIVLMEVASRMGRPLVEGIMATG